MQDWTLLNTTERYFPLHMKQTTITLHRRLRWMLKRNSKMLRSSMWPAAYVGKPRSSKVAPLSPLPLHPLSCSLSLPPYEYLTILILVSGVFRDFIKRQTGLYCKCGEVYTSGLLQNQLGIHKVTHSFTRSFCPSILLHVSFLPLRHDDKYPFSQPRGVA